MGDGGLDGLRQQNAHPVAAPDAAGHEHVGEPVGQALDIAKAVTGDGAVLVLDDQSASVRGRRRVPIADVDAHVVGFGNVPAHQTADVLVGVGNGEHRPTSDGRFEGNGRSGRSS